jgi:asparagine N-glycosylation enzyme membrane subunit Stt3
MMVYTTGIKIWSWLYWMLLSLTYFLIIKIFRPHLQITVILYVLSWTPIGIAGLDTLPTANPLLVWLFYMLVVLSGTKDQISGYYSPKLN